MSINTWRASRRILAAAVVLAGGCIGQRDPTLPLDQQQQMRSGNIAVTTTTSGTNPDTDGYRVTINEDLSLTISSNGSTEFSGLAAGPYTIQLKEVSLNCSVADNPRTVTVYAGTTSDAGFVIQCS